MMKNAVELALEIATDAHQGQIDKAGRPFIMHPVRVASYLHPHSDIELIAAALLHDVVEDTHWELDNLYDVGFSQLTIDLVDAMTRRKDETYKEYIYRVGLEPLSAELKLADLSDNMDPRRAVTPEIRGMIKARYVWSEEYLKGRLITVG